MAFYPSTQTSNMWLLAVAFASNEGKIKVLDITDCVARVRGLRSGGQSIRVRVIRPWLAACAMQRQR